MKYNRQNITDLLEIHGYKCAGSFRDGERYIDGQYTVYVRFDPINYTIPTKFYLLTLSERLMTTCCNTAGYYLVDNVSIDEFLNVILGPKCKIMPYIQNKVTERAIDDLH